MIDETDRGLAERWAWWRLSDMPSAQLRECMEWWLSFEQPPEPPSDRDVEDLLTRVWRRILEYKAGADYQPNIEDYAEWIGLDLAGVFESNKILTQMLVERAVERAVLSDG
jgi:hypothetical protein